MQLIIIRHAQSVNNQLCDGENVLSRAEFERIRSHDATLSARGEKQIQYLREGIARAVHKPLSPRIRDLKKLGEIPSCPRVIVAVSPMRRAILTSMPVIESLKQLSVDGSVKLESVDINPHIFEIGGCYSEKNGKFVGQTGMTAQEIASILPNAHIPESLSTGWWEGDTRETEEELEVRVTRTIEWIREYAHEGLCDTLVLVTHQDFACHCIRSLAQIPGVDWLYNTSISSFTLEPIRKVSSSQEHIRPSSSDSGVSKQHPCRVTVDWLNAVDHLPADMLS